MEKLIGLQSKLINSLKSGHLIVLSVLALSLFAATAPATAQAISIYQPSTYNAVYTSACQWRSCATRSTNQNFGYGSSTYQRGYSNYGSNYGYGYGSANYRNYNIGGMYAGYTPRIYSNYYGQRYYNYRQPSVGQYIGYYAGQYLQSRINNRGNCISGSGCVVNYYNYDNRSNARDNRVVSSNTSTVETVPIYETDSTDSPDEINIHATYGEN